MGQERARKARHGRYERRTLWALSSKDLNGYVGSAGTVGETWPGVKQVCRLQRVRRLKDKKSGEWETKAEVAYAITSLDRERAEAGELLQRWRVHWRMEDQLHWVRDVTFGEDGSQVYKGQAPEVFTAVRNVAITLVAHGEFESIAAGVRELGSAPIRILELFSRLSERVRGAEAKLKAGRKPSVERPAERPPTLLTRLRDSQ